MERKKITAWITKYALTQGIFSVEAEVCSEISEKMIKELKSGFSADVSGTYHKPDWHETKKDAVIQAEKMRTAKIASLKKSIAKIEKLSFEAMVQD